MNKFDQAKEIEKMDCTKTCRIKEVEVPIEMFQYNCDPSILDKLYEEGEDCRLGDLDDFLALPKPTFPKKPTEEDSKESAKEEGKEPVKEDN